ncbi:PDZ domain-containing protein [Ureibacillus sinduriensis]|uniref:Cell division protein MinJ n=1 Tax=Ureibacillus sinduriensis BLB-1 = JCM 15800 TaxID=1384057 RepID=A0A0A3HV15_9BACL|nr:PDZ domain-containing protein [Ureibacillus sinduriensis]KGR76431.1 cell division protein MinJ [Ureibacillus sinduriensis BLB-1 = JCM 15800]
MVTEILLEIARAIGRFFMNPIFYIAIIMAIYLGYRRVKRERKYFHIRILWGWSETIGLLKEGLLISLCISLLTLGFGLTLPTQFLYVATMISFIALIVYVFHFLSPIIIFSLSLLTLFLFNYLDVSYNLFGIEIVGVKMNDGLEITVAVMAGLLLVAEGMLIRKYGAQYASPIVENSKRGLKAVAFLSKKIWVLPIFVVIPGNVIDAYFPWWPQISLDSTQFSLVLFPVIIGFQQMSRHTLPVYLHQKLGRAVIILGEIIIIGGLVAYFIPIVGFAMLIVGLIARIGISILYVTREQKAVYAVSAKSSGVMIAGVLPNSPAEKMGLNVGEIIRKVNGVEVRSERELYEALQINAAHCRLEVLNHQNEVRLTQHVVYNGDHHRIGLLVAE